MISGGVGYSMSEIEAKDNTTPQFERHDLVPALSLCHFLFQLLMRAVTVRHRLGRLAIAKRHLLHSRGAVVPFSV